MNDCSNAEIRDRLPDLLHDRLDARARAEVVAHVERCADCRTELELLRSARAMFLGRTPRVDVGRIVQALPTRAQTRRRKWVNWRVAAAVTFLVVGGGSVAVMSRIGTRRAVADSTEFRATSAPVRPDSVVVARAETIGVSDSQRVKTATAPRTTTPAPAAPVTVASSDAGLAMTGRLGELSDEQLQALLKDIDQMEAVPITEPEPVVLPVVTNRRPATPGGI